MFLKIVNYPNLYFKQRNKTQWKFTKNNFKRMIKVSGTIDWIAISSKCELGNALQPFPQVRSFHKPSVRGLVWWWGLRPCLLQRSSWSSLLRCPGLSVKSWTRSWEMSWVSNRVIGVVTWYTPPRGVVLWLGILCTQHSVKCLWIGYVRCLRARNRKA